MKRSALGAIAAQTTQAGISLVIQLIVAQTLGLAEYGRFAFLYGLLVLGTAVVTGLVGDSLVVLDRHDRRIRAGLQGTLLGVAVVLGVVAFAVALVSRLATPLEAALFASAVVAFAVEEIVRRSLMVHLAFVRVAMTDLAGFVISLPIIVIAAVTASLSVGVFLLAIAVGQACAVSVGVALLPREDRYLVGLGGGDHRAVWRYGTWRALQQTLRPALLAAARTLMIGVGGTALSGVFDSSRTYTSPVVLLIGGMSSFLFVRFARASASRNLREADRVVLALLGITFAMSVVAALLAPLVGPLAFGFDLDQAAVVGWLVYGMTIALVTPYGALSAVTGRQTIVFLIRLADSALSLAVALILVAAGGDPALVPLALAVGSLAGGLALRWVAARAERDAPGEA